MPEFLIRLLIAVLVIVLVEYILKAAKLREPAERAIFVVTVIVSVLFAVFGGFVFHWPLK